MAQHPSFAKASPFSKASAVAKPMADKTGDRTEGRPAFAKASAFAETASRTA